MRGSVAGKGLANAKPPLREQTQTRFCLRNSTLLVLLDMGDYGKNGATRSSDQSIWSYIHLIPSWLYDNEETSGV